MTWLTVGIPGQGMRAAHVTAKTTRDDADMVLSCRCCENTSEVSQKLCNL